MVEIQESTLVVPCEETPKEIIWLSNMDLLFGHWYTETIILYRLNNETSFFCIDTIKAALSKALVYFYPYAGRLVRDENGRPEIKCTGEGALFVVARSEYTIDDIMSSSNVGGELVAKIESSEPPFFLGMFQVTFLKCGGVSLGVTMHHAMSDGVCALQFLITWSNIAKNNIDLKCHITPSFDRSIFRARAPLTTTTFNSKDGYKLNTRTITKKISNTTTHTFNLTKQQLHSLKALILSDHPLAKPPSTFKALLVLLWRCICKAWALAPNDETQVFIPVDFRSRVTPRLPENFFGNAIARTSAKASADELVSNPIGFSAAKIDEAITMVTDEYIRSIIDYVEALDFPKFWDKCSLNPGGTKNFIFVNSWLHLPFYDTDFGWGRPVYMARACSNRNGMVFFMQDPKDDGGVKVMITLEEESMERFKTFFYEDLKGLSV